MTGDEMVGWHHQLNGHEFELIPGDSEGQGSLACHSPWSFKESDTTESDTTEKQWHEVRVEVLFLHVHLFHIIFKRYICFDISENEQTNKHTMKPISLVYFWKLYLVPCIYFCLFFNQYSVDLITLALF